MNRRNGLFALLFTCACQTAAAPTAPMPAAAAPEKPLAQRLIIADGHVDVPYRLDTGRAPDGTITEDVSSRTERGDFDFDRARAGGLDAPFMSIYVPAKLQDQPGASKAKADELIDLVEGLVEAAPTKFAIATHPDQIPALKAAGKVALPMGIENGSALEDNLDNVAHFHARGIRYVTLTHSKDNQICDSSYDEHHSHKGLSEFGKKVVAEMNRVGIMVDVSHVSDDVIRQVLTISQAPVIASHSSARHFTPGFERNLSDELITAIADKDGVVLVNFGSTFISQAARDHFSARREAVKAFTNKDSVDWGDPAVKTFLKTYDAEHTPVLASTEDVVDHIEHIVRLVGVEHVGFGSDFDGVGPTLPKGLEDASKYPNLLQALLRRGYSEADLEKMASGNLFRVWRAVDKHAQNAAVTK